MSTDPDPIAFDGRRFRDVLGTFPTGVTVVTADPPGAGPTGMTIGSFTSVSLDPPLVAFLPARTSESWPAIAAAGSFCVNILCTDQVETCNRFASRGAEKFDGVEWRPAPVTGSPILTGSVSWIDCRIDAVHEAGDHLIVVGAVEALHVEHEGDPLLFLRGGYGRFDSV